MFYEYFRTCLIVNGLSKIMDMKKRMQELIDYLGMSVNAFEAYVGLSRGSLGGINLGLRSDRLALIAEKLPWLNMRWLLTGVGEMNLPENQQVYSTDVDYVHKLEVEVKAMDNEIDQLREALADREKTIALLRDLLSDMRSEKRYIQGQDVG